MGILNFTVVAAVLFWAGDLKFRGGENVTELWNRASAPLRDVNALLPPIAAVVGWFTLFCLSGYTAGVMDAFVVFFIVPILMIRQTMAMGAPFGWAKGTAGAAGALIGGISGLVQSDPVEADGENFELPMNVNESEADDVSTWFSDSVPVPRRSLLALGASGNGKSETLKWFVAQLQNDPDEPVVVYDHKTDYQDFLETRDVEMIRLSSGGSTDEKGSAVAWNVFEEMETEEDADEIARSLFPDQDGEGEFFSTSARQVFAATLKYLDQELENPTNADLVDYWQKATPEKMHDSLTRDGYDRLAAATAAIDPEAGKQAIGVFASAQQQVQDLFTGDFAREGDFSIREYMQNPDGRVLVLDYPTRQAETIAPIFRFLIDQSIMHGMDDADRQCFYLLDEIDHLKVPIKRLGELINVGRGNNCQAILSLQSVAQLYDTYGENQGKSLLSGMTTSIILGLNDSESVDYARETIGTSFKEYTGHVEKSSVPGGGSITTTRETKPQEEHVFSKGAFRQFKPGEAVVCRQGEGWVHGRINMLKE